MPSNDTSLEEENDSDVIVSLLNGPPFKLRPDDEKQNILQKGRPLHNITIIKRNFSKESNKTFQSNFYTIHKWLCGSKSLKKLFCWPCLLMRPESSSWCSIGTDDIKRFTTLAVKHARCKSHLKAIYEYDEALKNIGLLPEFISELKFKCKEEQEEEEEEEASSSDKTEIDMNMRFQGNEKKESDSKWKFKIKECAKESEEVHQIPNINNKVTFRAWKEMYKDNFLLSKSGFLQDFQLYKYKRKIAKQELRNARLIGEKLKFEIEVLKAKIEYHKSLKQNTGTSGESLMHDTSSTITETLQK